MFTKEERLFIWKKVYEMIDRLEDGEYICVALRNVVFMYFKTHKNIYEFRSDEMVRIYFPELEEKISMATEPEETSCSAIIISSVLFFRIIQDLWVVWLS